ILDEVERPNAKWSTTAPPAVVSADPEQNDAVKLTLASPTQGASIGYQVKGKPQGHWELYNGPVRIKPGETLVAKACRIGFRDSPPVELSTASQADDKPATASHGADWRPKIIDGDILVRLLALKEHDRDPTKAVELYPRTLSDKHPAMRYWAVVGLRLAAEAHEPTEALKLA